MVNITATTTPEEIMRKYHLLATTLRDSGIEQEDLSKLERIWLQRRDIPATLYEYARAAFLAGFTGEPMPELT
jgi:hypothetical protein